ncbi:MAG: RidA family protein [Chitinophagaceae bacterium]|nr:RidA family protein [Chitinophagaceae bacterium]
MEKKIIETAQAPAPIGPYNQAVAAGGFVFISGQICIKPGSSDLNNPDIQTETHQVMNNLKAILTEAGLDFSNIVKTTIFLSDMNLFSDVNEIYGKYFSGAFPARETIAVKGLPKNVNVEISMIAAM